MTFRNSLKQAKLLAVSTAALALSLSALLAPASASAHSGNMANPPVVASQCDHPGFAHFGFASKQDCLAFVMSHTHGHHGQGQGNGYGNGGGPINNHPSIFVSVQNIVNSTVNVTINFVTNIFS